MGHLVYLTFLDDLLSFLFGLETCKSLFNGMGEEMKVHQAVFECLRSFEQTVDSISCGMSRVGPGD